MTVTSKKLIEVALPLEAINVAAAREKSIRHGHPSTLHLWWARRPLAAARAVIFAQMVDDPSGYIDELRGDDRLRRKAERELIKRLAAREIAVRDYEQAIRASLTVNAPGPEPTLDDILAELERDRLFKIIEELVVWENTTNEKVLDKARAEIWQSWRRACARNADHPRAAELFNRNKLPAFHDPFAGGGTLPLEAQRLGLEAYASDLNPVAVLINKAMIEIPPRFAGRSPVHPAEPGQTEMPKEWKDTQGLADDVRYYGQWMRDEAQKRIGHLYPKVEITAEMIADRPDLKQYLGQKLTVIAWIWARTVKSPNPAFAHVDVPLASTFMLSTKPGKEVYLLPKIAGDQYRFAVTIGKPKVLETAKNGTKLSRGSFRCLLSDTPISYEYIDKEANEGRIGARLLAIVAEGERGRVYLPAIHETKPEAPIGVDYWKPDTPSRGTWGSNAQGRRYGFWTFGDYFLPRQLAALTTFADLIDRVRQRVLDDANSDSGFQPLNSSQSSRFDATAYADAVATYLAFAIDKVADRGSTLGRWDPTPTQSGIINTFSRQAIPMTWDFAEANPLGEASGNFFSAVELVARALSACSCYRQGHSQQADASTQSISEGKVVSTDPPYFNNVGYADLSDYFYAWLRKSSKRIHPDLFATVAVPKAEELIASPERHGSAKDAESFFLNGMRNAMRSLSTQAHEAFPVTIYYAYKQVESQTATEASATGWDTFLEAVLQAHFSILGTWPIRTELSNRMVGRDSNALASSIVLVCRKSLDNAPTISRREFASTLGKELPVAVRLLQSGNIAPVDLAQAAIGPGMGIFTRYAKVLDAEGKRLGVRDALALINHALDEVLAAQEGDFDADTRWALAWFEQVGFDEGEYGVAETLSKAKNTSVAGMVEAGILASSRGKVRLLKPVELQGNWEPSSDTRLTAWEILHHLIRVLEAGGESAASELARNLGSHGEVARELAYRLYTVCERKKRAAEALSYNALVQSWPEIMRLAQESHTEEPEQGRLL